MNTYLDTRVIALNLKDGRLKNVAYKSNIEFQFNGMIKQEEDIEKIQISLVNGQIPVSFYTNNYTNTMLLMQINGIQYFYTKSVGIKNASSLIKTLK